MTRHGANMFYKKKYQKSKKFSSHFSTLRAPQASAPGWPQGQENEKRKRQTNLNIIS